jgi:hypothetical protein
MLSPTYLPPTHISAPRVLRPRLLPPSNPGLLPYTRPPRVPVAQRWFYEPVPVPATPDPGSALTGCAPDRTADIDDPLLRAEVAEFVSTLFTRAPQMPAGDAHADDMADLTWRRANPHWSATHDKFEAAVVAIGIPPVKPSRVPVGQRWVSPATLQPRRQWMLDGDDRMDAEADAAWLSANYRLFNPPSFPTADRPLPTLQPGSVTTAMLASLTHVAASVPSVPFDITHAYLLAVPPPTPFPRLTLLHLNTKVMRRILAARESTFKYGVYLPRNDRDADASPESLRWNSGRQLEWLRLKKVGAFEYDWTRERLAREFPHYLPSDIGFLFFIYDYKFSGEHRVRLVFDGSRQGINTYDDTYSSTVRPESIRLFHVYAVEMG